MLFNSFGFLVFFPVVVCVYFLLPQKIRYLWLLAASYYFYMCWNPGYALLLLFSTSVTYLGGLGIGYGRAKKVFLAGTVCLNLGVLFLFKYFDFALRNVNWLFSRLSVPAAEPSFHLLLPVGISFYTFQALGYTIDVYRGEIEAQKNFLRYALFVSFFPQLVAGPIERSRNLLMQLNDRQRFDYRRMRQGLLIMLWGYYLKLVVADRAAIFVNTVYGDIVSYGGVYLVVATLLFAVQIYCDFAGYSTIARGAAMVMGFRLTENFEAPYFAKSVAEFWRRWHVSLSAWFRDYLYIPLGGNRKGKFRKYQNTMFVFLASGLWHGAAWNYVVWGGLNGAYQVAGAVWKEWKNKRRGKMSAAMVAEPAKAETGNESAKGRIGDGSAKAGIRERHWKRRKAVRTRAANVCKTLMTFLLIDITWLFFRAGSMGEAWEIIKSIVTARNFQVLANGELFKLGLNLYHFLFWVLAITVLWAADFFRYRNADIFAWVERQNVFVRYGVYLCLFVAVILFGIYGVDYEASQFIYFQF